MSDVAGLKTSDKNKSSKPVFYLSPNGHVGADAGLNITSPLVSPALKIASDCSLTKFSSRCIFAAVYEANLVFSLNVVANTLRSLVAGSGDAHKEVSRLVIRSQNLQNITTLVDRHAVAICAIEFTFPPD